MVFGAIRYIIRPVSRTLILSRSITTTTSSTFSKPLISPTYNNEKHVQRSYQFWGLSSIRTMHSLTDSRFPKRRPVDKPRRKRASLKPSGPYAWVKHVPGEPIPANQPNEGSVKHRNEKKRIRQRRAFILSEKKKRKGELQEANRKKRIQRIERKMAAVARDRAWAERLIQLQQLEEQKNKTT